MDDRPDTPRTPQEARRARDAAYYAANKDRISEYQAQYRAKHRERKRLQEQARRRDHAESMRIVRNSRKFGLTPQEYLDLYSGQGGKCAICSRPETGGKSLSVDHCHTTGRVRALLCRRCNTLLGNADDSPYRLRDCIAYLETHRAPRPPDFPLSVQAMGSLPEAHGMATEHGDPPAGGPPTQSE